MNIVYRFILIGLLTISVCKYTKAQSYDENFAKPITTEAGRFVYNELPPIKTEAGVLYFLDRNLGATTTDLESFNSWGDLYQWGRDNDGHEKRNSDTTLQRANVSNINHKLFIVDERKSNDWLINSDDKLWKNDVNNPCPCGYRLPTQKEWRAVLDLGHEMKKNDAGYYYISLGGGILNLPCAGLRSAYTGNFQHLGTRGYYWASDAISRGTSSCIDFNKEELVTNISIFGFRAFGRSVRCVRSE